MKKLFKRFGPFLWGVWDENDQKDALDRLTGSSGMYDSTYKFFGIHVCAGFFIGGFTGGKRKK